MTTVQGPDTPPGFLEQLQQVLQQKSSTPKASENKPAEEFSAVLRRWEDAANAYDQASRDGETM